MSRDSSNLSRRAFIGAASASVAMPALAADAASSTAEVDQRLAATLGRYDALGPHRSASPGNLAACGWLAEEARSRGFDVERFAIDVPVFPSSQSSLAGAGWSLGPWPQFPFMATPQDGITAPSALICDIGDVGRANGSITVVVLPAGRVSSLEAAPIRSLVEATAKAGAKAIVIVTQSPSREPALLNARPDREIGVPLCVLGVLDADRLLAAAREHQTVTLTQTGASSVGRTFNVIATAGTAGPIYVVSTPISGWFRCAAERGPGVAIWISLLGMAARHRQTRWMFLANSGHEYEYLGVTKWLPNGPKATDVALWVHLGAGLGARDYHTGGRTLGPLPSPDAQRYLFGPREMLPVLRKCFRGCTGLEAPYAYEQTGGLGELDVISKAGYPVIAGLGAHIYHHTPEDRLDKTSAEFVRPVAAAFRAVIEMHLKNRRGV